MTTPVLVIGSLDDPHVIAVTSRLGAVDPVVLDVARLAEIDYIVSTERMALSFDDRTIDLSRGWRGWIRRLSSAGWEDGVIIGSHDAAAMAAWLSLLATLLRHPDATWLTGLDAMNAAENKISQYIAASRLGLSVPGAMVTNMPVAAATCGADLIAKPLGPSHFKTDEGEWRTVFTEVFDPLGADRDLLAGPPFIVQERAEAVSHRRVVTVADKAWVFTLDGDGLPIDWREEARAHRDWKSEANEGLKRDALLLAHHLGVRYSSQDWIETSDDFKFVDLNPAGQWLFLPDPDATEISDAIAQWVLRG